MLEEESTTPESEPAEGNTSNMPLSEEEQMDAFENALKEADWGHQPC